MEIKGKVTGFGISVMSDKTGRSICSYQISLDGKTHNLPEDEITIIIQDKKK